MRRAVAASAVGAVLALGGAPVLAGPAHAAPGSLATGTGTSAADDDGVTVGDWGMLGLTGLFGLFGYRKYRDHRATSDRRNVPPPGRG